MRARVLLAATVLGSFGALLPAAPASACIHVYMPIVGSFCKPNPCPWLSDELGIQCR